MQSHGRYFPLVKAVKDAVMLLGRDAGPAIGDDDADRPGVGAGCLHVDRPAGGAVLDGIVQQVAEHLLQTEWIDLRPRRVGRSRPELAGTATHGRLQRRPAAPAPWQAGRP
jgi:hypothetical protein